jgi:hypothetical protein
MFISPETRTTKAFKPRRQRVTGAHDETPASTARRILDACNGDEAKAATALYREALARESLRDYMLLEQAKSMIAHVRLSDNKRILAAAESDGAAKVGLAAKLSEKAKQKIGAGFTATVRASYASGSRASQETLFDIRYGLGNGRTVRLGDATMEQLDAICAEKAGRIGSEYREMSWLRLIRAKGTRAEQIVSKVVTLAQAAKLRADVDELPV